MCRILIFAQTLSQKPTKVYRTCWIGSQMIIDFRLHTSDNALTENGRMECKLPSIHWFSHRHFHVITFSIKCFPINFVWLFLFFLLSEENSLEIFSSKHFRCNTNWQWRYVMKFLFKLHSFLMAFPDFTTGDNGGNEQNVSLRK